ncbi:unnamed protein product [Lactuca saligna]|uniref:Uncharacterized protein n=1 Tax=Lactuca saligna TaxID=75948 RepID=A0AA35YLK9_LACSI|nr:unnamed protein product [Lactuca saligna]
MHRNENFNPYFFKKDNAPDCVMGENIGHCKPVDVDMAENEAEEVDVADDLPNIFNEEQHWKEKKPMKGMRLWGSWMSDDQSFQIKSLVNEHNCARNFNFGSFATYIWI